MKRIIVGLSGASGSIYGIRLLEALKECKDIETHLVLSYWGAQTIEIETAYSVEQVKNLADFSYSNNQLDAKISSGSFPVSAVVILPCSMKTLAAIANGYSDVLMVRAADVALKEHNQLIIAPRETPFNTIHIENMLKLSRLGVSIVPPMPSFYNNPQCIDDLVDQYIGRILDILKIENNLVKRWDNLKVD